jgi:hypothetical protein
LQHRRRSKAGFLNRRIILANPPKLLPRFPRKEARAPIKLLRPCPAHLRLHCPAINQLITKPLQISPRRHRRRRCKMRENRKIKEICSKAKKKRSEKKMKWKKNGCCAGEENR